MLNYRKETEQNKHRSSLPGGKQNMSQRRTEGTLTLNRYRNSAKDSIAIHFSSMRLLFITSNVCVGGKFYDIDQVGYESVSKLVVHNRFVHIPEF
jgi:hypothetical protein